MTDQNIASVEIEDVSHNFDKVTLFSHFNYSFEKDKVTAILGKSGSGKSTLLQLINGMIKPAEGTIYFNGEPIIYKDILSTRTKMGYVVQHVGLFPHMTIRQNIQLLGKINHYPEAEINNRMLELMEMVNLSNTYLDKFSYELSGGEQQRAGLCRAMLLKPSLLLMDEPFASLDYGTKHKIYEHLLAIQRRESRTIILVTHDWEEAIKLADNFIWIEEGKIRDSGNKESLELLKTVYFSEL